MNKICLFLLIIFTNIVINYLLNMSSIFLNTLFKNNLPTLYSEKNYLNEINYLNVLPRSIRVTSNGILTKTTNRPKISKITDIVPYFKSTHQTKIIDFFNEIHPKENEVVNPFPLSIIFSISSSEMKYETELGIESLNVEIYNCKRQVYFKATLQKGETLYLNKTLPHAYLLFRFQYGNHFFFSKFIKINEELNHIQLSRNNKFIMRIL